MTTLGHLLHDSATHSHHPNCMAHSLCIQTDVPEYPHRKDCMTLTCSRSKLYRTYRSKGPYGA